MSKFNHYLQKETDEKYYHMNSLSYYYDKMAENLNTIKELAKKVDGYDEELEAKIEEIDRDFDRLNRLVLNGEVDKSVLRTEIDQKLLQLEQDYAPKLNQISQDLAQTEEQVELKAEFGKLPTDPSLPAVIRTNYSHVVGMDNEQRVFRANGLDLERSNDRVSWETVYTFNRPVVGVRQLDNGEIIVSTSHNQENTIKAALWLSESYGTEPTFTKVLEASDYVQNLSLTWGYGGADSTYVVSEYDSKPTNSRSPHQRVYLTQNYGKSWRTIYDHGTGQISNRHVHGAYYDEYRGAIWVTTGDYVPEDPTARSILVSWDLGESWQTVTTTHQPTTIYAFPDCVVFGSDNAPNGILRIDNPTPNNLTVDVAYKLNDSNLISHVAQSPYRLGDGYPLLIPFSTATTNEESVVLASYDGHTWFELWKSKGDYSESGVGARYAVGPLKNGQYIITGGDNTGDFNVTINSIEHTLISSLSRTSKYQQTLIPKRSYLRLQNQSSPFLEVPPNQWVQVLFNTGVFGIKDYDSSDLFTIDEQGVTLNRDCLLTIHAFHPAMWSALNPSVRVRLNGGTLIGNQFTPSITTTANLKKGDKLTLQVRHEAQDTQTLQGSAYTLVLDAWEVR